jgi:hypothetical protein
MVGVDRSQDTDDHHEHTVGVFRWVLDSTISKKSAAVGTGAIALRPLVDIGTNEERVYAETCALSQPDESKFLGWNIFPRWMCRVTAVLWLWKVQQR